MKKFLMLALALVFALSMAAPALAFTGDEPTAPADVPFEIALELVEYDTSDWTIGVFSSPPSDRGYAKNEIVCAIASLYVPKKADPWDQGFMTFTFEGDDVTLEVNEDVFVSNTVTSIAAANFGDVPGDATRVKVPVQDEEIIIPLGAEDTAADGDFADSTYFYNTANKTYAWAFFAKVTGDEASLTITLSKGLEFDSNGDLFIGDYVVESDETEGVDEEFWIYDEDDDLCFAIFTGKYNKSINMMVFVKSTVGAANDGDMYEIGMDLKTGEMFFANVGNGSVVADKDGALVPILYNDSTGDAGRLYNQLLGIYEDIIVDEFGFDFDMKGNAVEKKHFEAISGIDDLEETVVIEPWFAYVEVPPEVIVDPPKTGDAMSIVGFIMIAVAALAVVTVKKVRA